MQKVVGAAGRALRDPRKIARAVGWLFNGHYYRQYKARKWLQDSQVCLISFPRSGQTWLRTMLGYAVQTHYHLPDLNFYTRQQSLAAGLPMAYISHELAYRPVSYEVAMANKQGFAGKKILFLVRDVRDVMVSWYHYRADHRAGIDQPISEFLRSEVYGVHTTAVFHRAWYDARPLFREILVIRYEDLQLQPEATLTQALHFIGMNEVPPELVRGAIQHGSFSNMQKMEQSGEIDKLQLGLNAPDTSGDRAFVRKGKIHAFHDDLTPDDLAYIDHRLDELNAPKEWMYYSPAT
jgi:hypothetical protein